MSFDPFIHSDLISRSQTFERPDLIPKAPGYYAWFFRKIPPGVPHQDCIIHDGCKMLYLGIAPNSAESSRTLRDRIRNHFRGPARSSTLRRTLAILLEKESGYPLVRGKDSRPRLAAAGEEWLNDWMNVNALVAFVECDAPWNVEKDLLKALSCPLNVSDNGEHPFYRDLRALKNAALRRAKIC